MPRLNTGHFEKDARKHFAKERFKQHRNFNSEKAGFKLEEVKQNGGSAAEFTSVTDRVYKNINPSHNWFPTVTKIQLIHNPPLQLKFEEAKLKCFGTHTDLLFHGTGGDGIKFIPKKGFKLPKPENPWELTRMFGCGIYFSTVSSKSSQNIYTKGTNKLLLCEVLIGKAKQVNSSDPTLTKEKLKQQGFDSVYAPRDTQNTGGVVNDEFVVFDPDQALPKYIIHYTLTPFQSVTIQSLSALTNKTFLVTTILEKRAVDLNDPYKPHYDNAYTMFHKVKTRRS